MSQPIPIQDGFQERSQDSHQILNFFPAGAAADTPPLVFSTKYSRDGGSLAGGQSESASDYAPTQESFGDLRFEGTSNVGLRSRSGDSRLSEVESLVQASMDTDVPQGPPAANSHMVSHMEHERHVPSHDWETTLELSPLVVHRALQSRCRFIAFPPNLPIHVNSAGQKDHALFIGQVRFETSQAELIWLIHRTCGACASSLESRGAGCYLLFLKSQADLALVRGLHKRILFDVGGVWLARTPEEVDALCEYVAVEAPILSKKARLPRDSMVVEELKVDNISHAQSMHYGMGHNVYHGKRSMNSSLTSLPIRHGAPPSYFPDAMPVQPRGNHQFYSYSHPGIAQPVQYVAVQQFQN